MRFLRLLQSLLYGAGLGMVLAYPAVAAESALAALSLFARSVLPSLLPFSIFALMFTAGKQLPPAALVGGSLLGGSPTGARLFARAALDKRQAKRYAAMTGGLSPMFFLFTLSMWLEDAVAARAIFALQAAAGIAAGFLLGGKGKREALALPELTLARAIAQAAQAMLSVGASIALGAVIPSVLARALCLSPTVYAYLRAAFEVTGGCRELIVLGGRHLLPLLAFFTGFGGFSLLLQNAEGWQAHGLTAVDLLPGALLRAVLACGGAWGYVTFF